MDILRYQIAKIALYCKNCKKLFYTKPMRPSFQPEASAQIFLRLVQTALIGQSTSHRPRGYRCALAPASQPHQNLPQMALVHACRWPDWVQMKPVIAQNSQDETALESAHRFLLEHPFYLPQPEAPVHAGEMYLSVAAAAERLGISTATLQKRLQRGAVEGAIQGQNGRWLVPFSYANCKKCKKRVE
jgi:hypothetical protein